MIIDEDIYLEHFDSNGTMSQEVEVFLEHFGVKGMRWGVRNEAKKEASRQDHINRLKKYLMVQQRERNVRQ